MITHIHMKNFKSWKDSGEVKLAPLTGFFGTNSSGKSSLLQMLLLLKQTAERKDAEEVIYWGDADSYVNLGDFHEVIHGHDSDYDLCFMIGAAISSPDLIKDWDLMSLSKFTFETLIQEHEGRQYVGSFCYRSLYNNTKYSWKSEHLLNSHEDTSDINIKSCYGLTSSEDIEVPEMLSTFTSGFEMLFSNIFYLGPTRKHPQRNYHWEGNFPSNPGQWGDQTIDALLSARIDQRTTPYNGKNVSIEDRITAWLQKMELAHAFEFARTGHRDDKNYEFRIQRNPKSIKVTLADIGYGVAQFLPVLVLCYYVPIGSTLILEEPGTHLHPMAQADIADLLIEVISERKLQILVESHSEHLVTRLQRRIVEKQIAQDDVALYFCRNNDGASTIEKLDVDEGSGDIINWPENFFGNVMGDMFAMTDKEVERIAEKGPES